MHLKSLLFSTFTIAAGGAFAAQCGIAEPTKQHLNMSMNFFNSEDLTRLPGLSSRNSVPAIKVHIHVVAAGKVVSEGYITKRIAKKQVDALNAVYNPYDISFTLASIDWTIDTNWANTANGTELPMKHALRKGSYADLNLYLVASAGDEDWLGVATFPDAVEPDSDEFYVDGARVVSSYIAGVPSPSYHNGWVVAHEVGHWLGLYHTFQGGCEGEGDMVSDTPAENSPAWGCPTGRDSCTGQGFEGVDPLGNYMDYTDDTCKSGFTWGQIIRIQSSWKQYRSQK